MTLEELLKAHGIEPDEVMDAAVGQHDAARVGGSARLAVEAEVRGGALEVKVVAWPRRWRGDE